MLYTQPQSGPASPAETELLRKLKFAWLPPLGHINLVTGARALNATAMTRGASQSGVTYEGSSRAEFHAINISSGITIISIWRARAGQYITTDNTRYIASTKPATNTGWSYGRSTAAAGAENGNTTRQSLTFQGVAQYNEENYTIESFVDTPVACRYNPSTGKISWFRFGATSSPDTTAGTPTSGGALVIGAQGNFGSNFGPWIDRAAGLLIYESALTDAEIRERSSSVQAVWAAFADEDEEDEVMFSPAAAGNDATALPGGVGSSTQVGTVSASGAASGAAAGIAASGQVGAISGSAGARATPAGVTASGQVGTASASGSAASTASPAGVSATAAVGAPTARGFASAAPTGISAAAQVGTATATGGSASIAAPAGVSATASVGALSASGRATASPLGVTAISALGQVIASGTINVGGAAPDAATMPASRTVIFAGGVRVVTFHGGIRTVRF